MNAHSRESSDTQWHVDQRQRWRLNLRLYPFFYFFHDLQLWLPLWTVFAREEVGLSWSEIGAISPAFYVITSFGQAPAGAIADRFGRVRVMRVALVIFLVFILWLGFAESFWQAALAWSLWGTAWVLLTGTDSAFLHDSLQALGRQREFELQAGRAFAVRALAMVLATFGGGVVAGELGTAATVFAGAIGTGVALLISLRFREPPRHSHSHSPDRSDNDAAQPPTYVQLMKQTLRLAARTPTIRYPLIFTGLLMASMVPESYLIQPFLEEQGIEVGWLFTALQAPTRVATFVAAVLAFWLAMRFGAVRTLAVMPLWVVLVYAGIGLADHIGAVALFVMLGLARGAQMPLMEGYLNRRVPSQLRATALSLNHMGWALLMLPFLPVFGEAIDAYSLPTVFMGLSVFFGPLLLIIMLLWLRADRMERGELNDLPQSQSAMAAELIKFD